MGKSKRVRPELPYTGLGPRHIEVLRALGFGLSTKEVASVLDLNPKTVEYHRQFICNRLNTDMTYLPRIAWAFGLAPLCSLMLMVGCASKPAPVPVPPPLPMTRALVAPEAIAPVQTVTLGWNTYTDPTASNLKLYQGIASRSYTNSTVIPLGPSSTSIPVVPGMTNYFALTAVSTNTAKIESPFSNEASFYSGQATNIYAKIKTFVQTSTNNLFNSWTNVATFPIVTLTNPPSPIFFRTLIQIDYTSTP